VVTVKRDKTAALKFRKRIMKKYGRPRIIATDVIRAYSAAMDEIRVADRHTVGRGLNNRAENSLNRLVADASLDLHSGGSSLDIITSTIIEPIASPELHARNRAAAHAFGAPMAVEIDNRGGPRAATASAARVGLTVVGTEMAGAGAVSIDALASCRRGVRNVFSHLGALPPEAADPPPARSPSYTLPRPNAYVLAADEGVFEPFHTNGTLDDKP
jgi:predicted deacylase